MDVYAFIGSGPGNRKGRVILCETKRYMEADIDEFIFVCVKVLFNQYLVLNGLIFSAAILIFLVVRLMFFSHSGQMTCFLPDSTPLFS